MALTRKFLVALGIDDAKIDEIITAHTDTVNALKEARDKYKDDAEKLESVQKDLDAAKKKLNEYEDSSERDSWKVKYDTLLSDKKKLQKDFDDYKADITAKELTAKKQSAYKKLLKDAGVSEKRLDTILKVSDLSKIELDDSGAIKDADKLTESIKTEWSDFIATKEERGADVSKPGSNDHGSGAKPPMSFAAKRVMAQRASLYGQTKEE